MWDQCREEAVRAAVRAAVVRAAAAMVRAAVGRAAVRAAVATVRAAVVRVVSSERSE
jgi:hypothetical protein|tara:strand:+ start:282 stop:452 length:171 start_codon:yes stop_codon:yes gene_type:complete